MAKVNLSLETLGDLDSGRAERIIDHEIKTAIADLQDRGEDGQKRKVVIELMMVINKHKRIETHVKAQAKLPPRAVHPTDAILQQDPQNARKHVLAFQQDAPDNAHQSTLPFSVPEPESESV